MKKYLKTLILTSFLTLLPILVGLILWNQLPEQVPIHWNIHGEADGWAGKTMAIFGTPLFLLAMHWFCALVTIYTDPKKENHSEKVLRMVFWMMPLLSILIHSFIYATILGAEMDINMITPIFLGLLFTVVGNFLPKCKQNYTIGIKIPWTLNSEENWNKTHRLAGWVWTFCGLTMMATAFLGIVWILIGLALTMVFVPLIYSYVLYRKGI